MHTLATRYSFTLQIWGISEISLTSSRVRVTYWTVTIYCRFSRYTFRGNIASSVSLFSYDVTLYILGQSLHAGCYLAK